MSILITDTGKQKILEYFVGKTSTTEGLTLKLYSNNVTPSVTDTPSSYTEVTGGGYSSVSLTNSSWVIDSGVATYPQQTWTFTASVGNIYGYYVVNNTSNQVVFAERFASGPYVVANSGDIIRVTINLSIA
jgi:hypothetical protein